MDFNEKKLSGLIIQHEELYKKISSDFDVLSEAIEATSKNHKLLAKGMLDMEHEHAKAIKVFEKLYEDVHGHNKIVESQNQKIEAVNENEKVFQLAVNVKLDDFKVGLEKFKTDNNKTLKTVRDFGNDIESIKSSLSSMKLDQDKLSKQSEFYQKVIWGLCIVLGGYLLSDIAMMIL